MGSWSGERAAIVGLIDKLVTVATGLVLYRGNP